MVVSRENRGPRENLPLYGTWCVAHAQCSAGARAKSWLDDFERSVLFASVRMQTWLV